MHLLPTLPPTVTTWLDVAAVADLALLHFSLRWLVPSRRIGAHATSPEIAAYRFLGWCFVALMLALLIYLAGGQYADWPLG